MKALHGRKIKDGAAAYLEPGEQVLAGIVVAVRGVSQFRISMETAGFQLVSPMGLAITDRRMLGLAITYPWGLGVGGRVRELISEVPIADVQRIGVGRLLIGWTIEVTVRGELFRLEAGAGADANSLVGALEQAHAGTSAA
ncbi:MAG: hypothetical protein ACRDPC_28155 [Solirubrobacteraceae bacterium]